MVQVKAAAGDNRRGRDMLYDISFFWDGRHSHCVATAEESDDKTATWVRVKAEDAAATTIFVATKSDADELASLINKLVAKPAETADNAQPGDYVCGDCDRIERDPMFLDLEMCSKCGELITAVSDELPDCVWRNAETPFADNH